MNESTSLRDASVQEIQLELIRRSSFNGYDGERVYLALLNHSDLWSAVLLDRPGMANFVEPERLPWSGLIKLRDLPQNCWNADTLFVLTKSRENARRFAQIAEEEGWAEEIQVYEKEDELSRSLGAWGPEYGLVSIWWD